jgi:SNF family Na+-dependent transporter
MSMMSMMTTMVMTMMMRMKMRRRRTTIFYFTIVLMHASRPQETVNLINVTKRPKTVVTHVNPG